MGEDGLRKDSVVDWEMAFLSSFVLKCGKAEMMGIMRRFASCNCVKYGASTGSVTGTCLYIGQIEELN
jgi:hypothetical protein